MLSRLLPASRRPITTLAGLSLRNNASRFALQHVLTSRLSSTLSHLDGGTLHLANCKCPHCVPLSKPQPGTIELNLKVDPAVWKDYNKDLTKQEETALYHVPETAPEPLLVDGREVTTLSGIIKKYGALPFIGLGAGIIFGKEIVVIDDIMLQYLDFFLMTLAIYVGVGDKIFKGYIDERKKEVKWWNDWNSLMVEATQMQLKEYSTLIASPKVLKEGKAEYNEVARSMIEYRNSQLRHNARADIIKKLEQIKKRQDEARTELSQLINDGALSYVTEKFKAAPLETKNELVEMAIGTLEDKQKHLDDKDHPVFKYLEEYFRLKPWEQITKK